MAFHSPGAVVVRGWMTHCRTTLPQSLRRFTDGWAESRLRRRTRPLCVRLAAMRTQLGELSQQVEERFLGCGQVLQQQVELTSALGREGRQLVAQDDRVRRGEAAVSRMAALSERQLALGREAAHEVARLARTLDEHAERLRRVHDEQQQIARAFAPIRALQSFFRIEASTLPVEMQALFVGVADEMRRLEQDVSTSFAAQDETFADTRRKVVATAQELHATAARQIAQAEAKREEIAGARQRLEDDYARARERHLQLERAIGGIERETDAIVVSLQFQDITRQRLEHVRHAADELLAAPAHPTARLAQRARRQQVLCRVQAVQLEAVQTDLDQAAGTIAAGLKAVRGFLQDIERDGLSVAALQQISAGMDAMAAEGIDSHRVSASMMQEAVQNLAEAVRSARQFSATTTGAADVMRRLATEIHLMGLNAQVQAVHAQSGSLEVLAGSASQISHEAQVLSARFEAKLVAITRELAALVEQSEVFQVANSDRHEALRADGEILLQELTAENERTKAAVKEVGELLQRLGVQADELLRSLDLAEFSRTALEHSRDLFVQLAEVYGSASVPGTDAPEPELAEELARYTMEAERAAHGQVLAGETPRIQPPSANEAEPATVGGAQLAANVELF